VYSYSFLTSGLDGSKSNALGQELFAPAKETRLSLYGVLAGPRSRSEPTDTFLVGISGRPASNTFSILTKLRIHAVAGNNTIRLGISINIVSNTPPPVLGLYFSRYEIGHVCHSTVNHLIRFYKI
jgi:hypothetical protein